MNVLLGAIFASAIADMLMDAAAVLGGQETLRLLAQPLLQVSTVLLFVVDLAHDFGLCDWCWGHCFCDVDLCLLAICYGDEVLCSSVISFVGNKAQQSKSVCFDHKVWN